MIAARLASGGNGSEEDHSTTKGKYKTVLTLTGLLMEGLGKAVVLRRARILHPSAFPLCLDYSLDPLPVRTYRFADNEITGQNL